MGQLDGFVFSFSFTSPEFEVATAALAAPPESLVSSFLVNSAAASDPATTEDGASCLEDPDPIVSPFIFH
jgi:hypothetical protein